MSPFGPCVRNYPYDLRAGGVGIWGFKGLEARGVGSGVFGSGTLFHWGLGTAEMLIAVGHCSTLGLGPAGGGAHGLSTFLVDPVGTPKP